MIDTSAWALRQLAIVKCQACPVRNEARMPVPTAGPPSSRIMLVGRNPGRDEDTQGRPFIGRSGSLLDQTLARYGIDRTALLVTNNLKCFTTGNRAPTASEYATCMATHLVPEIATVAPKILVLFGVDVFLNLIDRKGTLRSARQRFWPIQTLGALAVAMYHPSAILRNPSQQQIWDADWQWLVRTDVWASAYLESLTQRSMLKPA